MSSVRAILRNPRVTWYTCLSTIHQCIHKYPQLLPADGLFHCNPQNAFYRLPLLYGARPGRGDRIHPGRNPNPPKAKTIPLLQPLVLRSHPETTQTSIFSSRAHTHNQSTSGRFYIPPGRIGREACPVEPLPHRIRNNGVSVSRSIFFGCGW